jgi:hypothetical protein
VRRDRSSTPVEVLLVRERLRFAQRVVQLALAWLLMIGLGFGLEAAGKLDARGVALLGTVMIAGGSFRALVGRRGRGRR